jgi:hypothetical protein
LLCYDSYLLRRGMTLEERKENLDVANRPQRKMAHILSLLEEGYDVDEVREKADCSEAWVKILNRRMGNKALRKGKELEVIAMLVQTDFDIAAIARRFDLTPAQVASLSTRARRAGFEFKRRKPGVKREKGKRP